VEETADVWTPADEARKVRWQEMVQQLKGVGNVVLEDALVEPGAAQTNWKAEQ
jgi:hypothetical protein